MPRLQSKVVVPLIFATVFVAFAVGMFIYFIPRVLEGRRAASWPSVEGRIISSSAVYEEPLNHRQLKYDEPEPRRWVVRATYKFTVNGQPYQSDRVGLMDHLYYHNEALEVAGKWSAGAPVPVYYNPADPSRSLLNREVSSGSYVGLIFAVLALALAGFVFWRLRVQGRSSSGSREDFA